MIRVWVGDLAAIEVEAIVRPIRSDLAPVSSQSRDVATAAGEPLVERLDRVGSLPIGGAVVTPGGDLPADFVIHCVVMSEEEPQSAFTVQRALRNGLRRAADWEMGSLAVPPLGIVVSSEYEAELFGRLVAEVEGADG